MAALVYPRTAVSLYWLLGYPMEIATPSDAIIGGLVVGKGTKMKVAVPARATAQAEANARYLESKGD